MAGREFFISNDSTGMFGTATTFDRVWGFAKGSNFAGVEAIGWKWLQYLMPGYKSLGIKKIGIHGRTGGVHDPYNFYERFKLQMINQFILPTDSLLKLNYDVEYVLVHAPELRDTVSADLVAMMQNCNNKTIFVENHLRPGALDATRAIVIDLRKDKINAGLMIDFLHVLKFENPHAVNFSQAWQRTTEKILRNIQEAQREDPLMPIGFHVPIGVEDGLPSELMTDSEWKDIAELVMSAPNAKVRLENQQKFVNSFILTPKMARAQREENERKFEILVKNQVVML